MFSRLLGVFKKPVEAVQPQSQPRPIAEEYTESELELIAELMRTEQFTGFIEKFVARQQRETMDSVRAAVGAQNWPLASLYEGHIRGLESLLPELEAAAAERKVHTF